MAPTGSPGTTGAPIAENKVVPTTEGVPTKTFKQDARTASVAPTAPCAGLVDAAIASLPNNAYKPEAGTPVSLVVTPFAICVIFNPTGGAPTLVLITAVSATASHIPEAGTAAL